MLKTFVWVVLAVVAAFAGYVALQPATYTVERSLLIAAPPAAVFAHIEDFRKWQAWSPWAKRDPSAKATFSGQQKGKGAVFAWIGNKDVGEGSMRIVEAKPDESLAIKLAFVKPFAGTSDVGFALKPDGGGTLVTWRITGEQGFVARAFCTLLRVNVETMIGDDYANGLAALKRVVEAPKS